jgi:hypothetical protein
MPFRMKRLAMPMINRKSADTVVPITPPILWNASRLLCITAAVAAIATDAMTTIVECPNEKKKPTE